LRKFLAKQIGPKRKNADLIGNTHAQKEKHEVEFGWKNYISGKSYMKVKKNTGGMREPAVSKNAQRAYLLEEATSLFFPGGISSRG
jgi:hypothetical protein